MKMPAPDPDILARRPALLQALASGLSAEGLIADPERLRAFECDGLTAYRQPPLAAVLPTSVEEVSHVLAACARFGVKVVPRGAGTSLSGGALPLADGVLLALTKLNRIKEIDIDNRCVTAEPGVSNLAITQAVQAQGFYYAPDPSSQVVCSIGGNVAENSGGVHCLKYGLTANNILGLELALADGEIVRLGGKYMDPGGLDLIGVATGSEGLLGVVTEATVRILRKPETARALLLGFADVSAAGRCVAKVIEAGVIPAGMEMMDRLAIEAVEAFCRPGYPRGAGAALIVELDGPKSEVDHLIARVGEIAESCGAVSARASRTEAERDAFWAGRKAAFPAMSHIAPDYYCMDGSIPRARLAEVLEGIAALSERAGLPVANVFHAGDGNLHPLILYDANAPGELERAERLGADILRLCVAAGGALTGEHGVGVEKRDLMGEVFTDADLRQQQRVKCAFDPDQRLNPGKVFPTLHRCAELGRVHVHGGRLLHPEIPRF